MKIPQSMGENTGVMPLNERTEVISNTFSSYFPIFTYMVPCLIGMNS